MQAIILSVGDELVLGQTVDTNSAYLSAQLAQRGIGTAYHQTLADDMATIAEAIRGALGRCNILLISGGLGPTEDDLTRHALAEALGEPLVLHEPSIDHIEAIFQRHGRTMPPRNRVQAMHPRGTTIIHNSCGTAPGIKAVAGNTILYAMPGVPSEMFTMFDTSVLPDLDAVNPGRHAILTATILTYGLGESDVADCLDALMDRNRNPKVGTTVANSFVSVRIRSESADPEDARRELDGTIAQVEQKLGPVVFGRDDETIQQALVALLRQRGRTVATAESCTGGLVGKLITDVPGSSEVYRGGWVTYTNQMKTRQLGVPAALLATHGAVSQQVSRCMASGALTRGDADLAVAVTGVAGPDGGSDEKPVGTVWVALAHRADGSGGEVATDALLLRLGGDRDHVRDRAAKAALQMLRLHAMGESIDQVRWGKRVAMS